MALKVQRNEAGTLHPYAQNGVLNFKGEPALKKETGKWTGSFPMLVIQVAATIIFFGIISNLVTYMTLVLHKGVVQSATDINNLQGTQFCFTVFGAFISDTYWGRYKTMSYSFLLYFLGLSSLTISASIKSLRPPPCQAHEVCKQLTAPQSALFYLSLYVIALAAGSMTTCLVAFGADQFDEDDDAERRKKHSYFNYVPFCIHIGGLTSVTALVYIEDNVGWSWGFGILLFVVLVAVIAFFAGTPRYRYRAPDGSPLTMITQVLVAALRKRSYVVSADDQQELHNDEVVSKGKRRIPHTDQFRWLDKAALVTGKNHGTDRVVDPWKLSTVTRVEEVKMVIRMLPVWLTTLWFNIAPAQVATFFVRQGMAMENRIDRSFKVPPASMLVFSNLTVIAFLPVYDRLLVPAMRRLTGNERGISLLQRIGIGLSVSILGMVTAALVEARRKRAGDVSNVSIFWLVPQYAVLGAAEGLTNTGLLEFFHEQSPDTFHSLGVSLALVNVGVGAFISSAFISCVNRLFPSWLQNDVNKGHLDLFYWLLAGLSVINLAFYVPVARWYSYKKAEEYVETVV